MMFNVGPEMAVAFIEVINRRKAGRSQEQLPETAVVIENQGVPKSIFAANKPAKAAKPYHFWSSGELNVSK